MTAQPRRKYLWRVTAVWAPATTVGQVRHYQSKGAALHRAAVLREGQPFRPDGHPEGPGQPEIPPAASVKIERSAAIDGWTEVLS